MTECTAHNRTTAATCTGSANFNLPRSSGQWRRNISPTGVSNTHASHTASCHRKVRAERLTAPAGGGPLRRIAGNSIRIVLAENTPSANQSKKNKIQIVERLGMNPAERKFDNARSPLHL